MTDFTPIESYLQKAWLSQLTREHQSICYRYRIQLKLPMFIISDNRHQMGDWSALHRIIRISHFLISEHPWSVTLQVLKHEMAHQLCSELHGRDDVGHGPLFRAACTRLGLDARFQGASADLRETLVNLDTGSPATEQGRQIIDKVRKLLALGASDNEHEAALAVQRAKELLARYRLDFDSLADDQHLVHRTINTKSRTLPSHRKTIGVILTSCFGVQVVCASLYDPQLDQTHRTIELLGLEEEVAIAEHCYHFLENRLQTLWQKNRRRFHGSGQSARKSYFLGLLDGFRETLERTWKAQTVTQSHSPQAADQLPALRAQQRLDSFVAQRFPRLSQMRDSTTTMHGEAYHQAVAEGREITLHKPVKTDSSPRLLE